MIDFMMTHPGILACFVVLVFLIGREYSRMME